MRKGVILLCLLQIILAVHGSAESTESPPKKLPQKHPAAHLMRRIPPHFFRAPEKLPQEPQQLHQSWMETSAPTPSTAVKTADNAPAPSIPSPAETWAHNPALPPSSSLHKHHHGQNKSSKTGSTPKHKWHSPTDSHQGQAPEFTPVEAPDLSPTSRQFLSPAPSPTSKTRIPLSPQVSPETSSAKKMNAPPPQPVMTLPPPPPNEDCTTLICTEPLTYSAPGSPCGCVWPIQVKLHLSVALYTFFPLVSELAEEIAAGLSLNRSQVRIMGANAASEQLEKTIVLVNLVPLGETFNYSTAFSTYEKFWNKQVVIRKYLFGAYETLYVRYPGLPPSPPTASSSINSMDDGPDNNGRSNNGGAIKPLGVDLPRRQKHSLGRRMVIVIVLSSVAALVLCTGLAFVLLLKSGGCVQKPEQTSRVLTPPFAKPSGATGLMAGSIASSASMSFSSSNLTYTGPAKTFSLYEIEKATDNFDASRILGEGGSGLVYSGVLDDGTRVAVKILKRDDQQGGREFFVEVEMLSRLHHRNLVKLIGICTEDHAYCLVYELIPNGSVESHLHGADKETAPLDWDARLKIALGAARGLAYLHEDSSPRVIHRDFKSSNILLEHDFTPKVSDFGLARTALDEGSRRTSTRVMGTFGYLAPEYAMTGHLLVKSDVYSYGVVLLELLTGRKPVDLTQPPGQENLVAWAKPLLTSKEGLEIIIDPALKSNLPLDSMAKVAAIASMCVQPEVANRPFMGEVVQALKLVRNEFDETKEMASKSCSQEDFNIDVDAKVGSMFDELPEVSGTSHTIAGFDPSYNAKLALSTTDLLTTSAGLESQEFGSFRRHSSSGPLRTGRGRQFWQRLRGSSKGSMSEHGFTFKLWRGSH
ncbi:Serine-threonine/tyrosine-protein kinase, catalytic domain [Dillenia turbinata]|uniref:Serine-threonine/tyrosine-protein kinase, catalytic domain n=1 Tax=Dillenia turbinata TaxID=194707 RepID=A0AAN8YQW4_9MAGN